MLSENDPQLRGKVLLAMHPEIIERAMAIARPFDLDAIADLAVRTAASSRLANVKTLPVDERGTVTIQGDVPAQPRGYFAIQIVMGPGKGQMVGGLVLGRKRTRQKPEETAWYPIEWDQLLVVLETWAG